MLKPKLTTAQITVTTMAPRLTQRHGLACDEAARLHLVVGEVHRGHQVADAAGGAPQRGEHGGGQPEAERSAAVADDAVELVPDQVGRALRQLCREVLDLPRDG